MLLGGISGDLAVQMLQRMRELDHLHDLNMYAPDGQGGLQLVTAHRLVMAAASERLEKTVARRNADFKEGQPGAEIHFDRGEFVGSMDACELRAIVSYSYGDTELRVRHPASRPLPCHPSTPFSSSCSGPFVHCVVWSVSYFLACACQGHLFFRCPRPSV